MPKRKAKSVWKYGVEFPRPKVERGQPELTDAEMDLKIEFYFIASLGKVRSPAGDLYGKGLPHHVKTAMKILWPTMYWHRWTDMAIDTFLKSPGRTACFGPSSSQKSLPFSRASLTMFYARPHGTTVLVSSTGLDDLRRRIWAYVVDGDKQARQLFPWLPGSLIESKLMLLADESDAEGRSYKNGIIGVACRKGGKWEGLEPYVGLKNDVVILACDEGQFMSVGFLDSLANLESNTNCYSAVLGNLPDVDNPLGWAAEPKIGWDALPDTDKSRVYETKWHHGRAIQFIGTDSPNLDYPEGMEPFRGLIGRDYIEKCAINYGRESDKFNMFASGKIPRSSMHRTVFTKAQCYKFNATHDVKWSHHKVIRGYGLDAAYSGVGGDRTVGFPFIIGKDVTGRWKLWLGTMRIFPGSTSREISHSEAIALECKHECEERGIPPEHVFFDGTGRSELTSAFGRLWSPQVVPIEFGGQATERPSFTGEKHFEGDDAGQTKMCKEVFDRYVTELWFALRTCILSDQLRGLCEEAILEGCQRKWEMVRGAKYCLETKEDMKERGLRSPDICDAIICCLEGARRLGFPLGKTPEAKVRHGNPWLDHMREQQWEELKGEELAV